MIIRKPIKLKAYRLSYIYKNESYSKYKNNLLLHNLTSNYELHKKMNLKNTYNPNLTELKEFSTKNSLLTKSKLSGVNQDIYSSKKSIIKPNSIRMDNLLIKNSINNSLMPKKSYKETRPCCMPSRARRWQRSASASRMRSMRPSAGTPPASPI